LRAYINQKPENVPQKISQGLQFSGKSMSIPSRGKGELHVRPDSASIQKQDLWVSQSHMRKPSEDQHPRKERALILERHELWSFVNKTRRTSSWVWRAWSLARQGAGFRIKKLRKRHVVHAACGVFGGQGWIRTIVRNANGFTVRLL
jgi:hypothetical protein